MDCDSEITTTINYVCREQRKRLKGLLNAQLVKKSQSHGNTPKQKPDDADTQQVTMGTSSEDLLYLNEAEGSDSMSIFNVDESLI